MVDFMTPPVSLSVAAALDDQIPEQEQQHNHRTTSGINMLPTKAVSVGVNKADLPSEVLDADSVFGVCVGAAHLHFELGVKQQHKVDPAVVSVHVHQEGVFHNQPASRPAKAELMMANAVQALDPVAARPLKDRPLPETSRQVLCMKPPSLSLMLLLLVNFFKTSAYSPFGPRSVTKERAPTERNSS